MNSAKKTIDTRGLFCPGPLQVLKGVVKQLEPGLKLELIADDPDSKEEIKQWCEDTGNTLESIEEKNGDINFTIILKR